MADISSLRALLKDRQQKAGALGTATAEICLDTNLLDELMKLEDERKTITDVRRVDVNRLAPGPEPDTTEIDTLIETKKAEIMVATVKLIFKSVSSVAYQDLLNAHPEVDETDAARSAFLDALADQCISEVHVGGELVRFEDRTKIADYLLEIRQSLTYGEWNPVRNVVFGLNRRKLDIPFSSTPSKKITGPDGS